MVSDPVALGLVAIGEDTLAVAWRLGADRPFSADLARWAARSLLSRPDMEHALRAALRHLRLISVETTRTRAHAPGSLARHMALVSRELLRMQPPRNIREELEAIAETCRSSASPNRGGFLDGLARAAFAAMEEADLPTATAQSTFSTGSVQP